VGLRAVDRSPCIFCLTVYRRCRSSGKPGAVHWLIERWICEPFSRAANINSGTIFRFRCWYQPGQCVSGRAMLWFK
jgi:hypothetical protein